MLTKISILVNYIYSEEYVFRQQVIQTSFVKDDGTPWCPISSVQALSTILLVVTSVSVV